MASNSLANHLQVLRRVGKLKMPQTHYNYCLHFITFRRSNLRPLRLSRLSWVQMGANLSAHCLDTGSSLTTTLQLSVSSHLRTPRKIINHKPKQRLDALLCPHVIIH